MSSMQQARRNREAVPDREHGVVVGIDVSKRWVDYGPYWSNRRGRVRRASQDRAGFSQIAQDLQELRGQGHEVWVGLEPTGAYSICLQEWLWERGWQVVQVNPYHVHRTKEVRDNSPRKSDCKDTGVIADLVWQGCYQQALRLQGSYALLRAASAEWASLGRRRTSLSNEFQALLAVWFPELAGIYCDRLCLTVRALVRRYADVSAIAAAGKGSLRRTVKRACRGRGQDRVEQIWQAARESVAPRAGQGARHQAMVGLLALLELIERRQAALRAEMAQLLSRAPPGACLLSLPGAGVVTVAGLLGECGDLGAYGSYAQLEKLVGLNLYTQSSGQYRGRCRVSKRGRGRARYVLCHMAMWQTRTGALWHEWAQAAKARGKRVPRIRVAVARKLLALIYALARDRALYQAQRCVTGDGTADGLPALQGTPAQLAAA